MSPRALRIFPALLLVLTAAPAAEPPVGLPPFVVSGATEQFRYYVELPECRILSSCSRVVTTDFAESHFLVGQMLRRVLPPEFLLSTAEPEIILLVDERHNRIAQEITSDLIRRETDAARPATGRGFLPNLRLWDGDSTMTFAVIRELEFDASA